MVQVPILYPQETISINASGAGFKVDQRILVFDICQSPSRGLLDLASQDNEKGLVSKYVSHNLHA